MRHVAVEFVHPVIVGKRALPALGLVGDSAPVATEVRLAAATGFDRTLILWRYETMSATLRFLDALGEQHEQAPAGQPARTSARTSAR